jgi:hypothetical protein
LKLLLTQIGNPKRVLIVHQKDLVCHRKSFLEKVLKGFSCVTAAYFEPTIEWLRDKNAIIIRLFQKINIYVEPTGTSYFTTTCFKSRDAIHNYFLHLSRVARFFLVQHNTTGKIHQLIIKFTKRPQSNCKIDQLAIPINTNIFICTTLKIYPNQDFWFENMPSGNPAWQTQLIPNQNIISIS